METVARIEPAQPPFAPEVQAWIDRTMPPGRPPLRLFATLARDTRLASRFFSAGLLDRGHLSLRERELVIARTTALNGAEYEWGVHIAIFGTRVGFDAAQQRSLVHGGAHDACWSDADRMLIEFADAAHERCDVDDGLWARLRTHFGAEAMLELLLLAGFYRTVSLLANTLRLPPEDDGARFPR